MKWSIEWDDLTVSGLVAVRSTEGIAVAPLSEA